MPGIALFTPDEKMYFQAMQILNQRNHHVKLLKCIKTSESVQEALNALSNGITIIIARGRQAHYIRQNTNIPVVEIQMTAQELGLLVTRAKQLISKSPLSIGLFGWGNMFCNTDYFDQLFHIQLHRYILNSEHDWQKYIEAAKKANCDVIIGGRSISQFDELTKIPHLYLEGTEESLVNALETAEKLYEIAETEQRNQAQFATVLSSATNGIIKINNAGNVLLLNHAMEIILNTSSPQALGIHISRILPNLNMEKINSVLSGSLENYSEFIFLKNQRLLLAVEPIVVNNKIDGAILSCTNLLQLNSSENHSAKEQLLKGNIALANFDTLTSMFPDLYPVINTARIYALSSSPMLIEATSGPELDLLAQSIHNQSIRKNGPYIQINIAGLSDEQQEYVLFGKPGSNDYGALCDANHGTLVIQSIDKLILPLQYRLVNAIRFHKISTGNSLKHVKLIDVRIIATSAKNLSLLRKQFLFRSDLLFILKALRIRIPSLKSRPTDTEQLLTTFMKDFCRQYSRYHVLSEGAKKLLINYPWEGNIIQLQSFCERMILTVQSRTISEEYVESLLEEVYEHDSGIFDSSSLLSDEPDSVSNESSIQDPYYDLLLYTLKKNHGNRKKTANELNISVTTLWRKMKYYQITSI